MVERMPLKHIITEAEILDDFGQIHSNLISLKNQNHFSNFRGKNIEITKNKIKESVKDDIFIVQCVNSIDEINKSINLHTKRLREWVGYPFPELSNEKSDNSEFIDAVINFTTPKKQDLMSVDIEKKHLDQIKEYASFIKNMISQKEKDSYYLEKIMKEICPNISEIAGVQIGARLIWLGGGLERLAMSPASKIQLLGAETALFRHLKTGAKSPKHGIIHGHPLVLSCKKEERGKIARRLADKISMATKIDYFKGKFIADKLKEDLK